MKIKEFITKTNFKDLHTQKQALLIAIQEFDNSNPALSAKLDGLLHFIDAFQDMCVDSYGVDTNEVFNLSDE